MNFILAKKESHSTERLSGFLMIQSCDGITFPAVADGLQANQQDQAPTTAGMRARESARSQGDLHR